MAVLDNMSEFSIKTFLSDMPRLLNKNFAAIKEVIDEFYKGSKKIDVSSINCSGNITAGSVTAPDIKLTTSNGGKISLIETLEEMTEAIKDLEESTTGTISPKIERLENILSQITIEV